MTGFILSHLPHILAILAIITLPLILSACNVKGLNDRIPGFSAFSPYPEDKTYSKDLCVNRENAGRTFSLSPADLKDKCPAKPYPAYKEMQGKILAAIKS